MKTINFSCLEILPSLLNKTKNQTLRPAWEEIKSSSWGLYRAELGILLSKGYKLISEKLPNNSLSECSGLLEKPPRFKVGEEVKLFWNQRSKYEWFCAECGEGFSERYTYYIDKVGRYEEHSEKKGCRKREVNKYNNYEWSFNKLLGTGIITEVFKIEMYKTYFKYNGLSCDDEYDLKQFAKRDGFPDAKTMFQVIDKMYDLSQPKTFYIYRWEWKGTD